MSSDDHGGQWYPNAPRPSQGPQWSNDAPPRHTGGSGTPGTPGYPGAPNTPNMPAPTSAPMSQQPYGQPPSGPTPPYTPSPAPSQTPYYSPPASTPQSQPQPMPVYQPPTADMATVTATSSRRRWLIAAGAGVVLLVLIVGALYFISQQALQEPMTTANTFCTDLRAQKYADAYGLLSSGYQAKVTSAEFAQLGQLHDQLDGKVRACGLAGLQGANFFNVNPSDVAIDAQMTRTRAYSGMVTLIKQDGAWKIDAVDDSLQGSDTGAWTTAARFCQALASKDYAAAYNLFTPAYQQQVGTVKVYTDGLTKAFGGGQFQVTGCQSQVNTYTVTAQGDSASLSGAFQIKVTTDAGTLTVPVPFRIAFAKIAGAWKIGDLEVLQSQG